MPYAESPLALQQNFVRGMNDNDVEALAACYAADATNYPLDFMAGIGPDSARRSWGGFFAAYRILEAGLVEDHLETHGETAIAWGQFRVMAEPLDGGEPVEMRGRYMDVARNTDKGWLYVADHASMPIG